MALDWEQIAETLGRWATHRKLWKPGQQQSVRWIATRLRQQPGVLIADEVGLGKTRLAVAVATAVQRAGGRIAILVPRGLMYQWENEFQKFHKALQGIGQADNVAGAAVCKLKTFADLFPEGSGDAYRPPDVPMLISHGFGVPQYLAGDSHVTRWGLPFWTKAEIKRADEGTSSPRLPAFLKDAGSSGQQAAAHWLEANISAELRRAILACEQLAFDRRPNPKLFADAESSANKVYQQLIGELIGAPDLVIIDEAHKSRAGAANEPGDSAMQSRLSACLAHILLHSSTRRKAAKRLALTATPFELDTKQWEHLLARIGVKKSDRPAYIDAATALEDALKSVDWHAGMDISAIVAAARAYEARFKDLMTRRRWQDHPTIKQFAKLTQQDAGVAHPHRRRVSHRLLLKGMRATDKLLMSATESLALLSKGENIAAQQKTAGARFAQAQKIGGPIDETPVPLQPAAAEPMDAKAQRRAFWAEVYRHGLFEKVSLRRKPEWYLQWHPRVREAIRLIERITRTGDKLLVFAAFDAPIQALTRALNIRRYLREVARGKATALAVGIRDDDPDFLEWCKDRELCPTPYSKASADWCHARYVRQRERLRGHCQRFVHERTGHVLDEGGQRQLTDWLVLHLVEQERSNGTIDRAAEGLLRALQDPERSVSAGDSAEAGNESGFDWLRVLESIKDEVPGTDIRRSAFTRQLTGGVKRAETRRTLQFLFNQPRSNPQVLVAQAAIASEGLNLHESCRKIFLFHLDWNPARIEQQIGRVDREDSLWMKTFVTRPSAANVIEIHTLTVDGTYDAHREEVIMARAMVLKAQLFGELVDAETLALLPEQLQKKLRQATPTFSPAWARSRAVHRFGLRDRQRRKA